MKSPTPAPPSATHHATTAPAAELDAVGYPADSPVWDVPWLEHLRDVPDTATWPRLMTPPHPDAVGTYADELAAHALETRGITFRWWQHLAAARLLEHDADGLLVWDDAGVTVSRQVGKSVLLAASAHHRLDTGADRWGESQLILHTGKDLGICVEVQGKVRRWASERAGYKVRNANGQEQIEHLADGSRWMVRAKDNAFGLSVNQAHVDEAWKVESELMEEGVIPTQVELVSPQFCLWSTAHRKATGLMVSRRNRAIDDLAATDGSLWLEWSADPTLADDDPAGWRQASPSWTARRHKLIARRYAAAIAGEGTDDPDELDPLEAFRTQWLNRWPRINRRRKGRGEPIIERDRWAACVGRLDRPPAAIVIAINDNYGLGGAVAVAAVDDRGIVEVDGRLCDSREAAFAGAARFALEYPTARTVVGITLREHVPRDFPRRYNVRAVGAQEAQTALVLLRDLAAGRRILHHDSGPLDDQMHAARVYPLNGGGLAFANNGARLDLLKATLWAVAGVAAPRPQPAIH